MWLLTLKSVLIATDLGGASGAALRTGTRLASLAGASIHLLHVAHEASTDDEDRLRMEFSAAVPDPPELASLVVAVGDPAAAIVERALSVSADAIIVGPHRRTSEAGVAMGSTAAKVVRTAPCPCLVAAGEMRLPLERILVPTDLSEIAGGALSVGLSWASALRPRETEAQLTVLYVAPQDGPTDDSARELQAEVQRAREEAGGAAHIDIREVIVTGADPTAEILRHASTGSADLLVMGTRGATGAIGGLGSVAAAVASATPVPLLLVPRAAVGARGGAGS